MTEQTFNFGGTLVTGSLVPDATYGALTDLREMLDFL